MNKPSFNQYQAQANQQLALDAAVRRHIAELGPNGLVQVKAVHPGNGLAGTVDIQPLTHQQDSSGVAVPHGTIYGVPYMRVQGGINAFIVDPAVGDIGFMVVAGRDQTNAVANRAPSPPASFRKHSMSDCVYVPGFLNNDPTQSIRISGTGITVTAPTTQVSGNFGVEGGATGSFTTPSGATVTVREGIITNIY